MPRSVVALQVVVDSGGSENVEYDQIFRLTFYNMIYDNVKNYKWYWNKRLCKKKKKWSINWWFLE